MPRFDGTGPLGLGPLTGRAAGECRRYSVPGYAVAAAAAAVGVAGWCRYGRRLTQRWRGGDGDRWWWSAKGTPVTFAAPTGLSADERAALEDQVAELRTQLEALNQRLLAAPQRSACQAGERG
jgi:hypothetical protein